jgi:hypothetical protein
MASIGQTFCPIIEKCPGKPIEQGAARLGFIGHFGAKTGQSGIEVAVRCTTGGPMAGAAPQTAPSPHL